MGSDCLLRLFKFPLVHNNWNCQFCGDANLRKILPENVPHHLHNVLMNEVNSVRLKGYFILGAFSSFEHSTASPKLPAIVKQGGIKKLTINKGQKW